MSRPTHKLPDLLRPGLRVVFCGTAAGARSAALGLYYAGPGNRFWWILSETELTPELLSPPQFERLLDFGIGLTDAVKSQAGADSAIAFKGSGRSLQERLQPFEPRYLCFNGKRAAMEALGRRGISYGLQYERFGSTQLFVAPSTSGAARRYWNVEPWREIASLVRG